MVPRVDPPATPGDTLSATLDAIVARYAAKVRWVARDCRLDADEVDDLVQDLRIRLWRVIERGERIASEKPSYVHRMVMSAAVDLIRRRRGTEGSGGSGQGTGRSAAAEPAAPADSRPDRAAESADVVERVNRAIGELSDTRRPVVRMYLAGYQIEEMARRLGWTEPKARNLLYRGLAELRQRLTLLGVEPEGER
jgi:RNA polymerase sigma-70 factor (ECF subfamily)